MEEDQGKVLAIGQCLLASDVVKGSFQVGLTPEGNDAGASPRGKAQTLTVGKWAGVALVWGPLAPETFAHALSFPLGRGMWEPGEQAVLHSW